jgi:hypothetical protein
MNEPGCVNGFEGEGSGAAATRRAPRGANGEGVGSVAVGKPRHPWGGPSSEYGVPRSPTSTPSGVRSGTRDIFSFPRRQVLA